MTLETLSPRAAAERQYQNERMAHVDFDMAPFTIAWEVTRACAYACVHCRADAQHQRDPRELTTAEAKALIERLAAFGNNPILIFTGGDPLMRPDVFELIAYASARGLRCSLTPTATALPTRERLERAREAGIKRVALSLDAPRPEIHDDFRKVKGSWQRTMDTLHRAHDVGLSVQVNTTVAKHNIDILHEMVGVFPCANRARHARANGQRRTARTGLQLAVRPLAKRAVRHQSHRRAHVPPRGN